MARSFVQLSMDERRVIARMHEKKISPTSGGPAWGFRSAKASFRRRAAPSLLRTRGRGKELPPDCPE